MNKVEELKLKKGIYQLLYDTILFDDIGILGKEIDKINAQLEILTQED